jgi:uncharacterized protein YecA (UPF0149 family)
MQYMKDQINKFVKASEGQHVNFEEGEGEDFVLQKSYLGPNDPCFCGSGKKVSDCHIPMEEFIRLTKKRGSA